MPGHRDVTTDRRDGAEQLSSDLIGAAGSMVLERARFQLPDGREQELMVFHRPDAAGVVPIRGDRLALVRQPRPLVHAPKLLEIVGGSVDDSDADPLGAAQRELAEEAGLRAAHWDVLGPPLLAAPSDSPVRLHLFLAWDVVDVPRRGADAHIDVVWIRLADLDATIDRVNDLKTLIALLLLRSRCTGRS